MVNVVEGIEDRIWDDGWYHHDGVAFDLREVAGVYYQELDECVHVMFRSGETWRFPDIEDPDPLSHCARLARKGRWDD